MALGQWAEKYIEPNKAAGGGGGGVVYELTQDAETQVYTLHASYNEIISAYATGLPLVRKKDITEQGETTIVQVELYAIVGLGFAPGYGCQCILKEFASGSQEYKTMEFSASAPDDEFVYQED